MLKSPRVEGWGGLEGECSEELGAGRDAREAGGQGKGRPSRPEVGFNPSCDAGRTLTAISGPFRGSWQGKEAARVKKAAGRAHSRAQRAGGEPESQGAEPGGASRGRTRLAEPCLREPPFLPRNP